MYVAGIDFDTRSVDVVLLSLDDNLAVLDHYALGVAGDAFDRCRTVRSLSFREWDDVLAIGIERPMGVSRSAVAALMRVQGAILARLPGALLVHELGPPAWKKLTVGNGAATKGDVMAWVLSTGPSFKTDESELRQDAADAYAIAWAMRSMIEHGDRDAA